MGERHDIPRLEREIKTLQKAVHVLAEEDDFIELLRFIHSPGYTTPAEFRLVSGVVATMQIQVQELTKLKGGLLAASSEIIEEHERVEALA